MISQEDILERVLSRVSEQVADSVKQTVAEAVQRELSSAMTKAMVESEFYRHLNEEMRQGLQGIYKEITSASSDTGNAASGVDTSSDTQKLFSDATVQIEEIMQTTLEATEQIMETTETLLAQQEEAKALIASLEVTPNEQRTLARLDALNNELESSLTHIITSLSFQDLTGQRLKKVVTAITSIRETVFDLYMSTGIMMKTREEAPEKELVEIAEESRRKVAEIKNSEMKGPSTDGASQNDVDDLLASLGL